MSCPFARFASRPAPHPLLAPRDEASSAETAVLPQPPEHLFGMLGNLPDIDPSQPPISLWKLAELYGPIFKLNLRGELVLVCDQKHISEICDETRFEKFIGPVLEEVRALLGDGLFTAHQNEPNWWKAHRILVPSFGPIAIRKMFSKMMDIASQMMLKWDRLGKDHEIDLADDFTRLAFDTIGFCAFSYRFNEFYSDQPHPFAQQMTETLLESGRRANRTSLENTLHRWGEQKRQENVQKMHALCDELIADRRRNPQPDNDDLLNVMLNTADPETGYKLTDENIRFNLCTFLVAGHETTSATLGFTMYNFLKNPEKMLKAQQQVDEVVGDGPLKLEHLSKLTYVDACIKETLRFSSPIGILNVHPKEDTMLDGKYPVTKGTGIQAVIKPMHHEAAVWGDDVEEFRPERMLDGGFEALPPNAWKPFGNGMRACIGRAFAEQEMLINVALILQRFQIEFADPTYDLKLKVTLTIKPLNFKMKVRRRPGKTLMTGLPGGATNEPTAQAGTGPTARSSKDPSQAKQSPISVFFGGNSGTCKAFAEDIETNAPSHGLKVTVASLDSATEHLPTDHPVIIITASYEGKPPDNARKFVKWLEFSAENKKRLEGVNYTVFGVGNSDWASTFHKIPKLVDRMMGEMGAQRFIEPGFTNAKSDLVGPWEDWSDKLWEILRQISGSSKNTQEASLEVKVQANPTKKTLGSEDINIGTVLENYELAKADVGAAKKHIEIRLPEGAEYTAGDYLVVLPRNPVDNVRRVLQRFNLQVDDILSFANSSKKFLPAEPTTALDFFSTSVELAVPVTRRQIDTIAAHAPSDLQPAIAALSSPEQYAPLLQKRHSILDLLDAHPVPLPLGVYVDMLPPLATRQYSISSSPLAQRPADQLHAINTLSLTYDVLAAPAWSAHGVFRGVASSYLAARKPGDRIDCFVRPTAVGFRLPADPGTPVLMMAAGTGIAPMIAFVQERAARIGAGQKLGPAALFFGCRDPEKDFLYREKLEEWQREGVVDVYPAFSRAGPEGGPKYVQDAVWAEREKVADMFRDGGRIYVCGSAERLGKSVADVCKRVYRERLGVGEKEADKWLEKAREMRYVADVY